jgi:hypothetical protein
MINTIISITISALAMAFAFRGYWNRPEYSYDEVPFLNGTIRVAKKVEPKPWRTRFLESFHPTRP